MIFNSFGDYIICDGAMGTMLQNHGLGRGERSDLMNMTAPQAVEDIHRMYVDAGSNLIYTNTFGANAYALQDTAYEPEDIIEAAVSIARRASQGAALVALDIGPIGILLEPMGDLMLEKAYELFRQQAIAGERAGADLAVIETMSDIAELKTAILAVAENTALPVVATMTFDQTGHTYLGCTPETLAQTAQQLGIAAVGINCSLAPAGMIETIRRIAGATSLPLVIKPNAGLPEGIMGRYSIDPAEFAAQMLIFTELEDISSSIDPMNENRVSRRRLLIGGCCGTTPEYIREIRNLIK